MRPTVSITLNRNGLRRVPPSPAQVCVSMGICSGGTPNVLASFGDLNTLEDTFGQGNLVENLADRITQAGQGQYGMPLNPSVAGAVGSTITTRVAGVGTVVGSAAPEYAIDIKIVTGGALGTMTFSWRVNGGAYSAPVTSTASAFSFLVPDTLTTVTFAAQTYTTAAVWTVSTLGVITLVGTGTVTWVTQVSSTLDNYDVFVTVLLAGAAGVGQFQYSVDGNNTLSAPILIPSGGAFAIPLTGVVLTFGSTFTLGDVYEIKTTTAGFTTTDVTNAMVALRANPLEWGFVVVHGMGASSSAAATLAATLDTQMTDCEAEFRFVFGIVETPTNGSPGGSTESDTTVASSFASFFSERVMVCAGDIQHKSAIDSTMIRRNCATAVATRLASIGPGTDPAEVGDPEFPLPNVQSLYRDEAATPFLDGQRFTTLTSMRGLDGYFVTNGNLMAPNGSDFYLVQYRRLIDRVEAVMRQRLLVLLSAKTRTDQTPGPTLGTIHPLDRSRVEKDLKHYCDLAVVATGDAQDTEFQVSPTELIISTGNFPVSGGVEPFGYNKTITGTLGLVNPSA